ncbi:unnamed protein product [Closterium sp. NIES-53]
MPFVFPDLGSFSFVSDLVTHLRSLDAGFRAACTDAQLLVAPPPHVAHCALKGGKGGGGGGGGGGGAGSGGGGGGGGGAPGGGSLGGGAGQTGPPTGGVQTSGGVGP